MVNQGKTNGRNNEETSDTVTFNVPATLDRVEFGHDDHLHTEEELEEKELDGTIDVVEWKNTENDIFSGFDDRVGWSDDVDHSDDVCVGCLFVQSFDRGRVGRDLDDVPRHPWVFRSGQSRRSPSPRWGAATST